MADYEVRQSEDGYGRVFIPRGSWKPIYRDLLTKERISVVRLSASMGWQDSDLAFLAELTDLQGIEIYSSEVRDASVIGGLHNLRLVGLDCNLRTPIDFTKLPALEMAKVTWANALEGLLRCSSLKRLNATNWPKADLQPLGGLTQLVELELTSRKMSSLSGITAFGALERLDLDHCALLSTLEELRSCQVLQHLEVTSCKAIRDISPIGALTRLRVLHLDDDGDIETLAPLQGCAALEQLSFFGTTRIVDGRISALEALPRLHTLVFAPRRQYDRTREEILSRPRG